MATHQHINASQSVAQQRGLRLGSMLVQAGARRSYEFHMIQGAGVKSEKHPVCLAGNIGINGWRDGGIKGWREATVGLRPIQTCKAVIRPNALH